LEIGIDGGEDESEEEEVSEGVSQRAAGERRIWRCGFGIAEYTFAHNRFS